MLNPRSGHGCPEFGRKLLESNRTIRCQKGASSAVMDALRRTGASVSDLPMDTPSIPQKSHSGVGESGGLPWSLGRDCVATNWPFGCQQAARTAVPRPLVSVGES